MKWLKSIELSSLEPGRSGAKAHYWDIQSIIRGRKGEPENWVGCQQMWTAVIFHGISVSQLKRIRGQT